MSNYVDGFILTIPKKDLAAYQRLARKAGKVWRDHGALAYVECAGDDMNAPEMIPFPELANARADQVVIFAWAVFKSRRDRDKANAAIMKDPRIEKMCAESKQLVDCKRMAYGGFKVIVQY
jgi:uncharacterized protein YbaA (DUF1428 family)